jgi:hypothetical protein
MCLSFASLSCDPGEINCAFTATYQAALHARVLCLRKLWVAFTGLYVSKCDVAFCVRAALQFNAGSAGGASAIAGQAFMNTNAAAASAMLTFMLMVSVMTVRLISDSDDTCMLVCFAQLRCPNF